MDQAAIDQRLAALGGSDLVHTPIYQRKRVKNPDHPRNGGTNAEAQEEIDVVVQRWTNERTGHVLEAYQKPDGAWEIEKDDPKGTTPKPAGDTRSTSAAADPNTPAGRKALEEERESQW